MHKPFIVRGKVECMWTDTTSENGPAATPPLLLISVTDTTPKALKIKRGGTIQLASCKKSFWYERKLALLSWTLSIEPTNSAQTIYFLGCRHYKKSKTKKNWPWFFFAIKEIKRKMPESNLRPEINFAAGCSSTIRKKKKKKGRVQKREIGTKSWPFLRWFKSETFSLTKRTCRMNHCTHRFNLVITILANLAVEGWGLKRTDRQETLFCKTWRGQCLAARTCCATEIGH